MSLQSDSRRSLLLKNHCFKFYIIKKNKKDRGNLRSTNRERHAYFLATLIGKNFLYIALGMIEANSGNSERIEFLKVKYSLFTIAI